MSPRMGVWGLRLFAAVAALVAWTLITLERTEPQNERVLNVDVVYDSPEGFVLLRRPGQVQIAVRGSESAVRTLNPFQISILVTPEPRLGPQEIPLDASTVQLPPEMTVTSLDPETLSVELDREATREATVKPRLIGEPAAGAVVIQATSDPATVILRGSERLLNSLDFVPTSPITLDGHALDFSETASIVSGQPTALQIVGPQLVQVTVELQVPAGGDNGS